ncbi:MAG: hypothetical protein C4524_12710, partial [Candidatus Zixiibacteriota bacterium]
MSRFISILLCLMIATSFALAEKVEVMEQPQSEDMSPVMNTTPIPGSDAQWDILLDVDVEALCVDNQIVGCEFAMNKWFITSGGNNLNPNKLYILNSTATTLLQTVDQPTTSVWGWRDGAFDGTYLYFGDDNATVHAVNPADGALVPAMNIPKPAGCAVVRSLAYDPASDHFWTGNFGSSFFEFTRAGTVVWSGAPPTGWTAVYGMAWDAAPSHAAAILWIFDQTGTPQTTIREYNPVTHAAGATTHVVPMLSGLTAQIAGGLGFTNQWNPAFYTFFGIVQGTAHDKLFALEMYTANLQLAAAPSAFVLSNNGAALTASLSWTNPTQNLAGEPLTAINYIQITRDNTPLTQLTGTPGQAMTYNDNVPASASYSYGVYAVTSAGNGMTAGGSAWIGLDTPGAPT